MKKIRKLLRVLGPGFITGAADDDPSGIATYSQAGAQFGYTQLWTALFSTPLMAAIQEMVGRIGLVTGRGLAAVIRAHYSKPVLYLSVFLLLVANTVNIGADLGAMAASAQLLLGIPFIFWLLGFTVLTLVLEIFVSYKTYAKFLKYLTLSLLAYVLTAFVVKQEWSQILRLTFIPHLSLGKAYLLNIVAVLGTTISPYLFFWQADEEVEEEIAHHELRGKERTPIISDMHIQRMRWDTILGMIFSNVIMFFIIVTAASTLGQHGVTSIATADQAAEALRPLAGSFTFALFATGVIGTGLLAVPVLAGSASYAIAEAFGWRVGLYRKLKRAHGFYGVITLATLLGLLVNFTSVKPFQMLYYTAVLNGLIAPPLMLVIMSISNNKKIMGDHTNPALSNTLGWIVVGAMTVAAAAFLLSF